MVQPHLCLAHAPVELVHGQQAVHVVGELVQHSSHRIRVIAGLRLLKHALRGSVVGRPDVAEQRAAVRRRACRWQQAGMQAVKSHAGSKPQLRWQVACALLGVCRIAQHPIRHCLQLHLPTRMHAQDAAPQA